MKKIKKILIAYDGSECADVAIADLPRAGLPGKVEARVISIAEYWPLPPDPVAAEFSSQAPSTGGELATQLANQAAERIRSYFPAWNVTIETNLGSAASEIIRKAGNWNPDLIVVGSHGRSTLGRLFIGSVSQRVVTDAPCSVRVARGQEKQAELPPRLLVAVDGSAGSYAMVRAVAERVWPAETEVRIVTVIGPFYHENPPLVEEERARARRLQQDAEAALQAIGLNVSATILEGDPKQVLVKEAAAWEADCLFVGSVGMTRFERLLLGSVSTAVVTRAHCSVEVHR